MQRFTRNGIPPIVRMRRKQRLDRMIERVYGDRIGFTWPEFDRIVQRHITNITPKRGAR